MYKTVSMSDGMSPTVSAATFVPANVNMASVEVDSFNVPVTFTVTSLTAGNETCFTSQTSE